MSHPAHPYRRAACTEGSNRGLLRIVASCLLNTNSFPPPSLSSPLPLSKKASGLFTHGRDIQIIRISISPFRHLGHAGQIDSWYTYSARSRLSDGIRMTVVIMRTYIYLSGAILYYHIQTDIIAEYQVSHNGNYTARLQLL